MTQQHLVFVTRNVPPTRDGVGDYTYALGRELAKSCRVTIVTTANQRGSREGNLEILPRVPSWNARGVGALIELIEDLQPSLINIQWVPFLWGKWGVNFALPFAVRTLRRRGFRVVTTVHEPFVPLNSLGHLLYGPLQRLALRLMIAGSVGVAVTTQWWAPLVRRDVTRYGGHLFWLPVGSNIPCMPVTVESRRLARMRLGFSEGDIVVAAFSPIGSAKMPEWIYRTWAAVRNDSRAALLIVGVSREELARATTLPPNEGRVVYSGFLQAHEVSEHLHCADLFVAPFSDGVSSRRTSVIAAFAHSLPVVTTRGDATEELFLNSPVILAEVDDPSGFVAATQQLFFDAVRRRHLSAETQRFGEQHFSWSAIARRLLHEAEPLVANGSAHI